nr:hypothetical protein [uncultured Desulfobacter sp.]
MAYKKIEYGISFADIAIQAYADKNRNLLFLRETFARHIAPLHTISNLFTTLKL